MGYYVWCDGHGLSPPMSARFFLTPLGYKFVFLTIEQKYATNLKNKKTAPTTSLVMLACMCTCNVVNVLRVKFDVDGVCVCVCGRAPTRSVSAGSRCCNFRCCLPCPLPFLGPSLRDAQSRPSCDAERVLLHGGDYRLRHRGAVGASRRDLQVCYVSIIIG